jgi:hypothetical protein
VKQLITGRDRGLTIPWIFIAGEVEVDEKEADAAAIRGRRSGQRPVNEAEDSRSCARRALHAAGLGTVVL